MKASRNQRLLKNIVHQQGNKFQFFFFLIVFVFIRELPRPLFKPTVVDHYRGWKILRFAVIVFERYIPERIITVERHERPIFSIPAVFLQKSLDGYLNVRGREINEKINKIIRLNSLWNGWVVWGIWRRTSVAMKFVFV